MGLLQPLPLLLTLPILRIAEAAKELRSPRNSSSPADFLSPAKGAYMGSVATSMHALPSRTPSCSCSIVNTRYPTIAPSDTEVPLPSTEGATRGSEESAGARGGRSWGGGVIRNARRCVRGGRETGK
ncbi:hypothetical protein B484DRAFT_41038 [Ochromonadaceae sp. CCMP2298]|nr:hypothetical protein B484DRAFT_41038 [Ochromonadaceae sp. CCMP2298]